MKKLFLSVSLLLGAMSLCAGVVYVAPEATGVGDGSTWDNAMSNIQMAIAKAKEDPTGQTDVWVKAGMYNLTTSVVIKDSVNLYGGFAGTETSLEARAMNSADPWDFANQTILDGQNTIPCMKAVAAVVQPVVVDGFVLQHGAALKANNDNGGGIRLNKNVTLQNSIVRECYSDNAGGGVYIYPGGNTSGCLLENNRQETGSNGGGALYLNPSFNGSEIRIENCVFRGNTSSVRGGAINCNGQINYYINACTFYNNSAISTDGNTLKPGGAIFDNGANKSTITNCVMYNNTGLNLVYLKAGKFNHNTVVYNVGGVYVASGNRSSEVCNNIVWANATDAEGVTATGISGVAASGLVALNNYTYNPLPADKGWVLSKDPEVATTNVEFASNKSNADFEAEEGAEIPEGKCLAGPHFEAVPSFLGALPSTLSEEDKALFRAELDAVDLHINNRSALLHAASEAILIDTDRDGNHRPQGPRADVGAYEMPCYNVRIPAYNKSEGEILNENGYLLNDTMLYVVANSVLRSYLITADGNVPYRVQILTSTDGGITFNGEKIDVTTLIDPETSILDLTISEPVMLEVIWRKYSVQTFVLNEEMGTVKGAESYVPGMQVTIEAVANDDFHFTRWSDGNTDNPRTFTITQDTTFTAEFASNRCTLTTRANDTERGTTQGDIVAEYLTSVQVSAIANYGYHFTQWNDGSTDNPHTFTITQDTTFTAEFDKNTYTITTSCDNGQGTISGPQAAEYLDNVTLSVTPDYGYHFTRWSDGNTDNPRTFTLTRDTTFTAEFALDHSGKCGDNLYWNYSDNELKITGTGAMYNYTATAMMPWHLLRDSIITVRIANAATSIGEYAFANTSKLAALYIGAGVEHIGANAFAGCRRLYDIYCYPTYPPFAETTSFANYNVYLYVPCENQRDYTMDVVWGQFRYIECIGTEDVVIPGNTVTVTPGTEEATFTWPVSSEASTYSLVINKAGVTFCTLVFNAQGQLVSIAFKPAKKNVLAAGGIGNANYAEMTTNGFRFTVTGLDNNTDYIYTITVRDASNAVLETYEGVFTTQDNTPTGVGSTLDGQTIQEARKVLHNGQVLILRGGKTYTLTGQEAK